MGQLEQVQNHLLVDLPMELLVQEVRYLVLHLLPEEIHLQVDWAAHNLELLQQEELNLEHHQKEELNLELLQKLILVALRSDKHPSLVGQEEEHRYLELPQQLEDLVLEHLPQALAEQLTTLTTFQLILQKSKEPKNLSKPLKKKLLKKSWQQ